MVKKQLFVKWYPNRFWNDQENAIKWPRKHEKTNKQTITRYKIKYFQILLSKHLPSVKKQLFAKGYSNKFRNGWKNAKIVFYRLYIGKYHTRGAWKRPNNIFINFIVLEPSLGYKATFCQRVSQSVPKWLRKQGTNTHTDWQTDIFVFI